MNYVKNGYRVEIEIERDEDGGLPWEASDGHGPVSDWERRNKAPYERILIADRDAKRFYDFAEAVKIAKRDGWDAPPYGEGTAGERAVRAVEADFKYLKDWCDDKWHWVGYIVKVFDKDDNLVGNDSCWGIDDEDYAVSEAKGAADYIIDKHGKDLKRAAAAERAERKEAKYWAARDVRTE